MMDVVDEIYKTIDVMIQRNVEKLKMTQMENGVVLGESGKHDNKYKVRINGTVYNIKDGIGIKPAPNTTVYVCIPKSDMNQAYICGGKNASFGYVTEEALESTRDALEDEIQAVYDACVSGGAVLNSHTLAAILEAGSNISITDANDKLTIAVNSVISDVKVDGTSVVTDGVANISTSDFGRVKDVTVNGTSVVNSQGVAVITQSGGGDPPVTDVWVDGVSVLDNKIAKISSDAINIVKDVKVNGFSVLNAYGIANIPVPSIPVTDVTVDGTSVLNGTVAEFDSSDFGTYVVGNPNETPTVDLEKIQIDNVVYNIPSGGGSGDVVDVYVNGTSVLDSNKIAQIDLTNYATDSELANAIATLQASFQDGVDAIYNACVRKGSTPASHSLADVVAAIYAITSTTPIIYQEVISETTLMPKFESSVEEDD